MTEIIRLPQVVSAARADAFAAEAAAGVRRLYVPAKVSFKGTVAASLATQAAITWAVRPAAEAVQTNFDVHAPRASEALERNTPLLAAIHLAPTVLDVTGADITEQARLLAADATRASADIPQRGTGLSVGTNRTVLAVDHVPDFERPRGLYPKPELDESARAFYAGYPRQDATKTRGRLPLGHRALGAGPLNPEGFGESYSAAGHALGQLLFELIQNTHLHARHPTRPSVRLIQLRGVTLSRPKLVETSDSIDLSNFYSRIPSLDDDQLRFLAVSVLDSGPGLARTLMARENKSAPTPDQELTYFLRALRMTALGRTREPMRGMGLRRIQTVLSALGGYARIRSGRYEVYRDFIHYPYLGPERDEERSWYGGLGRPSPRPLLTGTGFSLVIPLPPQVTAEELWKAATDDV